MSVRRMLRRSGQHVASCSLCGVAWFVLHVAQRRLRLRCVQLERIIKRMERDPNANMSAIKIWTNLTSALKLNDMIGHARATGNYSLLNKVQRMSAGAAAIPSPSRVPSSPLASACPLLVPRIRQSLRMLRHSC